MNTASPHERYAEWLLCNNLRSIPHETAIIDATFSMRGTFSAEDITAKVGKEVSERRFWDVFNRLGRAKLIRLVKFNGRMVYVVSSE